LRTFGRHQQLKRLAAKVTFYNRIGGLPASPFSPRLFVLCGCKVNAFSMRYCREIYRSIFGR
jgi:hypothetical protein